jgi:hypothetical protein
MAKPKRLRYAMHEALATTCTTTDIDKAVEVAKAHAARKVEQAWDEAECHRDHAEGFNAFLMVMGLLATGLAIGALVLGLLYSVGYVLDGLQAAHHDHELVQQLQDDDWEQSMLQARQFDRDLSEGKYNAPQEGVDGPLSPWGLG